MKTGLVASRLACELQRASPTVKPDRTRATADDATRPRGDNRVARSALTSAADRRHGRPPRLPRGPSPGAMPIGSQAIVGGRGDRAGRRDDLAALPPRSAAGTRRSRRRRPPCTRGGRRRRRCRRSPGRCSRRCRRPSRAGPRRSHPAAFSSDWRACIAIAQRSARSAWSSNGSGAPKTAITASPWNLSIVPPWAATTSAIADRCRPTTEATSRASSRSAIVEKPRMSLNRTVTSTSCGSIAESGCEASRSASCWGTKLARVLRDAVCSTTAACSRLNSSTSAGRSSPPAMPRNSSVTCRSTASCVVPSAAAISA